MGKHGKSRQSLWREKRCWKSHLRHWHFNEKTVKSSHRAVREETYFGERLNAEAKDTYAKTEVMLDRSDQRTKH